MESPLLPLDDIRFITDFPLDYMHLACLGVQKRMLKYFKGSFKGINTMKLSELMLNRISSGPSGLTNCKLPSEFNRQPRTLSDLEHWKATEFRSFMLYTGMVVLRPVIPRDVYHHFLSFSVAMRMLCEYDNDKRNAYVESARQLLKYFVYNAHEHYGLYFTVYNIHNLLYLPDDVMNQGRCLDEISAFAFENYYGTLKRLARGRKSPMVQVVKRLDEYSRFRTYTPKNVQTVDCAVNSWFSVVDGYIQIKEISRVGLLVDHYRAGQVDNFFTDFIKSVEVGVVLIKKNLPSLRKCIQKTEIKRKCACLPYKDSKVLIELLHPFKPE